MQSIFRGNLALSPFFNETHHRIEFFFLPWLETFRVMQDKPVVIGVAKSSIDVGFPRAVMRDLLLGRSVSMRRVEIA
jgi:hypothetical protein